MIFPRAVRSTRGLMPNSTRSSSGMMRSSTVSARLPCEMISSDQARLVHEGFWAGA